MKRRGVIGAGAAVLGVAAVAAAGLGVRKWRSGPGLPPLPPLAPEAEFLADFTAPVTPPPDGFRVYHLGHSLVGRDMPAFLAQMSGHSYESQLGWGTTLREHWEEGLEIRGFEAENAHPRFRPAREALASGDYAVFVMTEMSSLADSLKWHVTPHYIAEWAKAARAGRPDVQVWLYQSWRNLDDPAGWEGPTTADLPQYWVTEFLRRAFAAGSGPVHLIPGGAVLVAAALAAEAGEIPGLSRRQDFFDTTPDGTPDPVHMSDLGAWLIALTHAFVIRQRLPETLPEVLRRADGSEFRLPPDQAAALAQIVVRVASAQPGTGLQS